MSLFKNKKVVGLTSALVLASMLVGCGGTTPSTSTEDTENKKPQEQVLETDVVVIGAGGAGLASALEVTNAGKEAIILEKMPVVGGNTLRATGGLNAAETSVQSELGIEDSKEKFYEDTMKGGHDKNIPELVNTLTQNAADAVEWLIDLGGDFTNVGRLGGASNDRAHRPEGGDPVGPEVVSTLRTALEDKGMEVMTNTTATEILSEDGVVTGVVAEDEEGNELTISADAVIISTGGFGANSEMQVEYNSELEGFGTTNHPGATGDGIKMALELGSGLTQIKEIQTHPTTLPNDGYMITEAVRGNGALLINRDGERFIDEIETRDVVSEAILSQENGTAFLFFNQEIADSLGAIDGYIKRGLTVEGETIEELAETLEIPAEKIAETVEKYNGFVAAGEDTDFNRGDMPRSIEGGKYYAIEVTPSVHHTMGGLTINTDAQVLTEDGEAIEGLFAAGEVVGGVHGGNRLGGNALSDIVVFGRIAGQNAAK